MVILPAASACDEAEGSWLEGSAKFEDVGVHPAPTEVAIRVGIMASREVGWMFFSLS